LASAEEQLQAAEKYKNHYLTSVDR
jgi:hypothetical protein